MYDASLKHFISFCIWSHMGIIGLNHVNDKLMVGTVKLNYNLKPRVFSFVVHLLNIPCSFQDVYNHVKYVKNPCIAKCYKNT